MLKGADTDELAARGDSSASGHQTLLISYHGKTFCYRASDCIDGKPEEENSPNGSYRYTHKKYVCELFLITHIHIIRGERKASLPLRKVVMQESGYPEPAHFRFADRTNPILLHSFSYTPVIFDNTVKNNWYKTAKEYTFV